MPTLNGKQVPDFSEYDYVVVGAGSAGCVVASRLSENPNSTVLLIEAGPSDKTDPRIDVPGYLALLQKTDIDWDFKTQYQPHACKAFKNQVSTWPRGKVLGGSSAINGMAYVRGHKSDFDSWEKLGCHGWGWTNVLSYFLKLENDLSSHTSITHPSYHSRGGPFTVTNQQNFKTQITREFINAGVELGYDEIDTNSGELMGFGAKWANIADGVRCSTATAYVHPVSHRHNFTVLTNAHVTKVQIEGKRATGVWYRHENSADKFIRATKEVVLSAGAVSTPQILMLSGIGPKEHLKEIGIQCVADLPVGENLQDHMSLLVKGTAKGGDLVTLTANLSQDAIDKYQQERSGPLASNCAQSTALLKTGLEPHIPWPDIQLQFFSKFYTVGPEEPAIAGITDPRLQRILGHDLPKEERMRKEGVTFIVTLLHPKSVGDIKLRSANPLDPPVIDPHYFEHPHDVKAMAEGVRIVKKLTETSAFGKYQVKLVDLTMPDSKHPEFSDENLDALVRYFSTTLYHPTCTCKMGSVDDPTTVVDHRLRVRGIKSLRVVDASVMPHLTSGNTNAPIIMIGEKGADLIKEDHVTATTSLGSRL